MAGFFTDISKIGQSKEPDTQGKLVVFDPAVFNRTNKSLKDWSANRNDWQDVYKTFKSDWEGGQADAEGRAKQETGFLDKFYNGDFASYLSGLRNKEGQARRAAGDRALEYAQGATDRASLLRGDPTGNSSAARAMAYRYGKDIENEVALNDVARERGDFDYLNRSQQANIGTRQKLMDAVVNRKLVPHQMNEQELNFAIANLAAIQGVRMGAASPVFWRETGIGEDLAAPLDDVLGAYGFGKPTGTDQQLPTSQSSYQQPRAQVTGMNYGNVDTMMNGPQGGQPQAMQSWYDAPVTTDFQNFANLA